MGATPLDESIPTTRSSGMFHNNERMGESQQRRVSEIRWKLLAQSREDAKKKMRRYNFEGFRISSIAKIAQSANASNQLCGLASLRETFECYGGSKL
jgi:hypothetical protein